MTQVTKQSLQDLLFNHPKSCKAMQIKIVGKALVHIFNRQTQDEKSSNSTNHSNGIGFTGGDAKGGTITAKYYLKHGTLQDWQLDKWLKSSTKGFARITKYHGQLNDVAEKATQKKPTSSSVSYKQYSGRANRPKQSELQLGRY